MVLWFSQPILLSLLKYTWRLFWNYYLIDGRFSWNSLFSFLRHLARNDSDYRRHFLMNGFLVTNNSYLYAESSINRMYWNIMYQLNVLEFDLTFCLKGTTKDVHTKWECCTCKKRDFKTNYVIIKECKLRTNHVQFFTVISLLLLSFTLQRSNKLTFSFAGYIISTNFNSQ